MDEFEKLKADLIACTQNGDTEIAHIEADEALIKIALSTNLTVTERYELVKIWSNVDKWYA